MRYVYNQFALGLITNVKQSQRMMEYRLECYTKVSFILMIQLVHCIGGKSVIFNAKLPTDFVH